MTTRVSAACTLPGASPAQNRMAAQFRADAKDPARNRGRGERTAAHAGAGVSGAPLDSGSHAGSTCYPDAGSSPLDEGARVGTDVVTASALLAGQMRDRASDLLNARGGHSDLVLIAVPAGEGVTVEHRVRKALGVQS